MRVQAQHGGTIALYRADDDRGRLRARWRVSGPPDAFLAERSDRRVHGYIWGPLLVRICSAVKVRSGSKWNTASAHVGSKSNLWLPWLQH